MRLFGLYLLLTLVAVGCNADPRCRRETALLRAEILDLEDKLAFANAGISGSSSSYYDDQVISSSGEVIISDTIIDTGEPQIIYESEPPYLSSPSVSSPSELEVQHQIFSDPPVGSSTKSASSIPLEDLNIEIDSPQPPKELDSILPNINQKDGLDTIEVDIPTNGSNNLRPRSRPRRRSQSEIEISLDGSPAELEIDFGDKQEEFITEIIVNRHASVGQNLDGQSGDEGLNLLVQPRTADGSIHVVAGELSVDLVNPNAPLDDQTIGHWQFLPSETELFFASDRREGEGILLHLPWEQNLPTHRSLVVTVSFTTPDGRKLSTSTRLHVDPPAADYSPDDPQVAGWTERDTRWEIGTNNQSAENGADQWAKSNQLVRDPAYKFDQGDSLRDGDSFGRPRVKAIPASTTRPATQLPSWRPVR